MFYEWIKFPAGSVLGRCEKNNTVAAAPSKGKNANLFSRRRSREYIRANGCHSRQVVCCWRTPHQGGCASSNFITERDTIKKQKTKQIIINKNPALSGVALHGRCCQRGPRIGRGPGCATVVLRVSCVSFRAPQWGSCGGGVLVVLVCLVSGFFLSPDGITFVRAR